MVKCTRPITLLSQVQIRFYLEDGGYRVATTIEAFNPSDFSIP